MIEEARTMRRRKQSQSRESQTRRWLAIRTKEIASLRSQRHRAKQSQFGGSGRQEMESRTGVWEGGFPLVGLYACEYKDSLVGSLSDGNCG